MVKPLNRQSIDTLITRARTAKGKQLELADALVAGLRIRAGERSATWLLCSRLRNGTRTRIKLGAWPGMGLSDAREAAWVKYIEVLEGVDPNEEKREAKREAIRAARMQRKLSDVLDDYERLKLSQLRRGSQFRRAIDEKSGVLKQFGSKDITSITRADIVDAVRKHAEKALMAANRKLAYVSACDPAMLRSSKWRYWLKLRGSELRKLRTIEALQFCAANPVL